MSSIDAAADGYDLTGEQVLDAVSERVERENRLLSEVLTKIGMDEYQRLKNGGATLEEIRDSVTRIQERGESFEPDPPGGPWPEPIPFDAVELPSFPVDKLPPPLDALTEAMAECYQVDPAMVGVLVLGVLAGLFQGKFRLHVKPGFTTELSLYTCAVAAPGERKTPVFKFLTAPINHYERERQEQEAPEIQRNQQRRKILEGRQKELESQLVKGKGKNFNRDSVTEALEEVNQELDDFVDEYGFRVMADDTTNEKLIDLLDKHGAILVASDEPGLFTSLKGRYDANAGLDVYLKGIDGSYIRVDRIGRPSNSIPSPHLSLSLGAQPAAIRDFVNNPVFSGRGLVQRFLYAKCESAAGSRRWEVERVPTVVSMGYEQLIREALDFETAEPLLLRFTEDGQREAERFGKEAEAALQDGGTLDFDKGWGNKFPGYVFRIAALFHLCAALSNGQDMTAPAGAEWLEAAEAVGWCLAQHTKQIFSEADADSDIAEANYILKRLQAGGELETSKRELLRSCKRFKKADDMAPALELLEERNYLRRELVQTGGRPTERIFVNPSVLKKKK